MIKFMEGDMFADRILHNALVNPVNCVGVMGAGLALKFKEKYPKNFESYVLACRMGLLKNAGDVYVFRLPKAERDFTAAIFNVATKQHYKEKSTLTGITSGIENLISAAIRHRVKEIAVPALGCGLGGLEWAEVKAVMQSKFEREKDVTFFVYPPMARGR